MTWLKAAGCSALLLLLTIFLWGPPLLQAPRRNDHSLLAINTDAPKLQNATPSVEINEHGYRIVKFGLLPAYEKEPYQHILEEDLGPLRFEISAAAANLTEKHRRCHRISDESRKDTIAYGILTTPCLFHSRLRPLLMTSMRGEPLVFAFYHQPVEERDSLAWAISQYNTEFGAAVHAVNLPLLKIMTSSVRNSWLDLPAAEYMYAALNRTVDWYSIIDDDSYILQACARHALHRFVNHTHPVYIGDVLTWGRRGSWRVVKSHNGETKPVPSSQRKPVSFVCGGAGIFMNPLAILRMLPVLEKCKLKHLHPAGDIRLGQCMSDALVEPTQVFDFIKERIFRSIGELNLAQRNYPPPCSFHRFREREWFHALRAIEDARGSEHKVQWEDIKFNIAVDPQRGFYHSLFFPKQYTNYSASLGIGPVKPGKVIKFKGVTITKSNALQKIGESRWPSLWHLRRRDGC